MCEQLIAALVYGSTDDDVAVQCYEEHVHGAATSTAYQLVHRQTQQEASAVARSNVTLAQHQRSQQRQDEVRLKVRLTLSSQQNETETKLV